jgi:uncharacterized protein (DUF885 family)
MNRFIAALCLAFACVSTLAATPAEQVNALAEELLEREYDMAPIFETFQQGAGPRQGKAGEPISPERTARQRALYRDVLAKLAKIALDGLNDTDRDTAEILRLRAQRALERLDYPLAEMGLLMPGRGIQGGLIGLATNVQPFRNENDFELWLSRVEGLANNAEHAKQALEGARKRGWTVPKPLVEKSLKQMHALLDRPVDKGPLWAPMKKYPVSASTQKRAEYELRYKALLDKRMMPALREYADYVEKEYLPIARTTAGIGALPDGDKAYRALVRDDTTLDLTPGEVHDIGLAEMERIKPKLLEVARGLGFRGEMKDFNAWLESSPANHPYDTPQQVIDDLNGIFARIVPQLPKLFKRLPKAGFEIRPTPPELAASASASYSGPPADGSRPGIFFMPIPDPHRIMKYELTTVLLHEGMPGHHLDIGLKRELPLSRFRKANSFTVYSEGWGLYAESLGHEIGVYDDPWALLGRYVYELHRAARLVLDTGIHWKGWSREQAIRYHVEERGSSEQDAIVAVERYMANPGQAIAYKIGEREILRLKAEAKRKLGDRFDVREFHEAVLGEGNLPLPLLRNRVEKWMSH